MKKQNVPSKAATEEVKTAVQPAAKEEMTKAAAPAVEAKVEEKPAEKKTASAKKTTAAKKTTTRKTAAKKADEPKKPTALIIMDGFGHRDEKRATRSRRRTPRTSTASSRRIRWFISALPVWTLVCRTVRWATPRSAIPTSVRAASFIRS